MHFYYLNCLNKTITMKNYLKPFLSALILAISLQINAQLNFKSGYIITLENDTLFGLINDGGGNQNANKCIFKSDKKGEVTHYLPGEIKSYRFIGGSYFVTQKMQDKSTYKSVFSEVLIDGKIKMYHYSRNNELAFYIDKGDGNLIGLLNKRTEVPIAADGLYAIQNGIHYVPINSEKYDNQLNTAIYLDIYKDTLFSIFYESEKVRDQIDSIKYSEKSLMQITKNYINETCEGDYCILYEKELGMHRPKFGFYSGISMSSLSFLDFDSKADYYPSIPMALSLNIPFYRFANGLSMQVEIQTRGFGANLLYDNPSDTLDYSFIKSRTLTSPISLRYQLERSKFSPSIAIGFEPGRVLKSEILINEYGDMMLFKSQKTGLFYDLGLNYKLAKNISIFTILRYQAFKNLIISNEDTNGGSYSIKMKTEDYISEFRTSTISLFLGMNF